MFGLWVNLVSYINTGNYFTGKGQNMNILQMYFYHKHVKIFIKLNSLKRFFIFFIYFLSNSQFWLAIVVPALDYNRLIKRGITMKKL